MEIKNKIIIGISVFLIFVIYFIYLNDKSKNNLAEIQKEYPTLNFNTRLDGIVKQKIVGGHLLSNSTVRIILNNGKFAMYSVPINNKYIEPYFNNFIQAGDSIYKKADNDTIYLYTSDKEYYFVLNK